MSGPDAVVWRTVALGGVPRTAASVPGNLALRTHARAPRHATLVAFCAPASPGPEQTRVSIEVRSDGFTRRAEATLTRQQGWSSLRLPLRNAGAVSVAIELRAHGAEATVLWADPAIVAPKPLSGLLRTVVRLFRQHGVAGLAARLRTRAMSPLASNASGYAAWVRRHTPDSRELIAMADRLAALPVRPRFALCVDPHGGGAVQTTLASVFGQVYPEWEAWLPHDGMPPGSDHRVRVVPASLSEAAMRRRVSEESTADFVAVVRAGDTLAAHALLELATAVAASPGSDFLYTDEDYRTESGSVPDFKPGWSPELLLGRQYTGALAAIRRTRILAAGGYRDDAGSAADYDLVLRLSATPIEVAQVPRVLYHGAAGRCDDERTVGDTRRVLERFCAAEGRPATVTPAGCGTWRVRRHLSSRPGVTIVIPTDARGPAEAPLVTQCLRSLVERTACDQYDILVADNGRLPDSALPWLALRASRRISYQWSGPFNFSRKLNFAVAHAPSPYVVFLNDDVEVISPDWLDAMLEYALQPEIGAVGAKLFYPDGRLQHVGVVTGVCGVAAHLLHQHPGTSKGCGGLADLPRNCTAVTGACLLTRRELYDAVGGFDEQLVVDFNDVDYCLKLRRAGYRIVYTPHAKLYHHESATFGARVQSAADRERMWRKWGDALLQDPYYNPNLSRDFPDCRLAPPAGLS